MKLTCRRILPLLWAAALAMLALAGCAPAQQQPAQTPTVETAEAAAPETTPAAEVPDFRFVPLGMSGAATGDGFYEVVYARDAASGAGNLVYTDFASRRRVYLSADPASDHQSTADTSYLTSLSGGHLLAADGQHLYFARLGMTGVRQYTADTRPVLLRMAADGSGRQSVRLPDGYRFVSSGGLLTDGERELLLVTAASEDGAATLLAEPDFAAGALTILADLKEAGIPAGALSLQGWRDGRLLLFGWQDADDGIVQVLYTYDWRSGKTELAGSFPADTAALAFDRGQVWYCDTAADALYTYDWLSGTQDCVLSPVRPEGAPEVKVTLSGCPAPGLLRFSAAGPAGEAQTWYWDRQAGRWFPLQLYQGDKPVTLEARTDGGYLLHMGSREVTYQDTTPAGESYTNTMQVPCYAMIASQDLWEGRADLIEIRDEVYG